MRRIVVTGANGFVGKALCSELEKKSFDVVAAVRRTEELGTFAVGDIDADTDWSGPLKGADTVIHLAARVHVMQENSDVDPIDLYRKVNVEGTINLANQALEAGVKRFIFISSIKVNGENTNLGRSFSADDVPDPSDPYGVSKYEAEMALNEIGSKSGLEIVVIRPVLVYGPGVKANFHSMMKWLSRSFPLPLGSIHNKRSLVALDNLVDLIVTCIDHGAAVNQTFLVSDDHDLSTTMLLRSVSRALGKSACLLPVPASLLMYVARLLGREAYAHRILGSLQVDIEKTKELLGWSPPVSVENALRETAKEFISAKEGKKA